MLSTYTEIYSYYARINAWVARVNLISIRMSICKHSSKTGFICYLVPSYVIHIPPINIVNPAVSFMSLSLVVFYDLQIFRWKRTARFLSQQMVFQMILRRYARFSKLRVKRRKFLRDEKGNVEQSSSKLYRCGVRSRARMCVLRFIGDYETRSASRRDK